MEGVEHLLVRVLQSHWYHLSPTLQIASFKAIVAGGSAASIDLDQEIPKGHESKG